MAVHELKIRTAWLERLVTGEKRAEVRKHDRDYQAGDTLHLIEVGENGYPKKVWVERDERGRFVNEWRQLAPVEVTVTHVLEGRHVDGLDDDYCVLSIALASGWHERALKAIAAAAPGRPDLIATARAGVRA